MRTGRYGNGLFLTCLGIGICLGYSLGRLMPAFIGAGLCEVVPAAFHPVPAAVLDAVSVKIEGHIVDLAPAITGKDTCL